jgi:integrase
MARPINRLSTRTVQSAGAGYHADGAGLYLLVAKEGSASWVFRFRKAGRLREMGLGSAAVFTLAEARERARAARKLLADGLDPIDNRRALRTATPRTWGEAKTAFIATRKAEWKNEAQAHQWTQSLADYGPADSLPVTAIDTDAVLACLSPLWKPSKQGGKVETATRVMGRIARIWDAEKVAGGVTGENPARWKGHLEHLLPKPRKVQPQGHHSAMPYDALPAFMAQLRARGGLARKALEFTILTVARTEETTGATWGEFSGSLWSIPGERMKAGLPHEVPLTKPAVAILDGQPKDAPPFPLSENGMLALLQKDLGQPYTVHGFRSAFSDWAHETTGFPKHVIDMALAHKIEDKADAAYRRGALLKKRRQLMEAWAAYLM